jgi:hypothetical protein
VQLHNSIVRTKMGPIVRIIDHVACDLCRVRAEREAAKLPSWAVVEIDRGPKAEAPSASVLIGLTPSVPSVEVCPRCKAEVPADAGNLVACADCVRNRTGVDPAHDEPAHLAERSDAD